MVYTHCEQKAQQRKENSTKLSRGTGTGVVALPWVTHSLSRLLTYCTCMTHVLESWHRAKLVGAAVAACRSESTWPKCRPLLLSAIRQRSVVLINILGTVFFSGEEW